MSIKKVENGLIIGVYQSIYDTPRHSFLPRQLKKYRDAGGLYSMSVEVIGWTGVYEYDISFYNYVGLIREVCRCIKDALKSDGSPWDRTFIKRIHID